MGMLRAVLHMERSKGLRQCRGTSRWQGNELGAHFGLELRDENLSRKEGASEMSRRLGHRKPQRPWPPVKCR